MSNNAALGTDQSAYNVNAGNASTALGNYQGTENEYLSNVNGALAAGNPYESKDYLTQQNLETSGAMNSANDAAKQEQQQTVARTGTNSAALANEEGSEARAGQRQLTDYTAGRNTENEQNWLGQQDKLLGDQAAGANSEASVYGSTLGASSSDLGSLTTAADQQQKEDDKFINEGIQAGGAALGV